MRALRASLRHLLLLSLLCAPLLAQNVFKALTSTANPPASAAEKYTDPLGRDTPRGALTGFMEAAQKGNDERAAEYLQLPRQLSAYDAERYVVDLKSLLDYAYVGRLGSITDNPDLVYDPQLEANHQRVGEFSISGRDLPLLMVRVPNGENGYLWLISWSTLSKTGDLAEDVHAHEFERRMPAILVRHTILSIPLWVWLAFLALIPAALAAAMLASFLLVSLPMRILARMHHRAAQWEAWSNVRGPMILFATAAAHAIGLHLIAVPLLFREYYARLQGTALLFAVAWLLWDFVSLFTSRMRQRITAPEDRGTLSLILLAQRMLKVLIGTAAFLSVLYLAGFNLSAALAGLGIGGIAVALAAQKTIENLFGGIAILTDHVIRVGDLCRVGTTTGTVEDIGLRSTRIRTFDRGLIAVPNGALSAANIENLSARDKMRIFVTLSLSLGTSAKQLESLMAEVEAMLRADARLEPTTSWIKLATISASGVELELQTYVRTRAYDEFMAARQEILLRLLQSMERNGCSLSGASQTIQMVPAPGKGSTGGLGGVSGPQAPR